MSSWKVLKRNGKFCWWAGAVYDEEVDNFEWDDVLTYSGYGRGKSSCIIYFWSQKFNCNVHMFMTDFDNVVNVLTFGKFSGRFTFCKRGQNYGVRLL